MFGSAMLEVAIGLIFVFLLVSLICSAIREGIEARLKSRAAYLEHGIRELLHDRAGTGLARSLYRHPLVYGLFASAYAPGDVHGRPALLAKGGGLPSYIPARTFAVALVDIAARGTNGGAFAGTLPDGGRVTVETVRSNVLNLGNEAVERVVLTALDAAQGDLSRTVAFLEAWYDSSMDRVSGWYKRSSQWIIFWVGLALAIGLNVDTLAIAKHLYHSDAARDALVARAEAAAADPSFPGRGYAETRAELDRLDLPIGWADVAFGLPWAEPEAGRDAGAAGGRRGWWNTVFSPLFGWLLTALAATLGAPFWFDLLNKVMVIRSTVKPREKSPEEASEDRQPRARPAVPALADGSLTAPGGIAAGAGPPGAGGTGPAIPPPPDAADAADAALARDLEHAVDACDIEFTDATPDEELPAAEGGVAATPHPGAA